MSSPLLATKFYIPTVNAELVARPRLIARLTAGLGRKLTLIAAPAGFGKTTLLIEWIQAKSKVTPPIAVAWLSLGERDNDPVRFWTYVIAALRTLDPRVADAEIGRQALILLQAPQTPPSESIITSVINDIDAASQTEHMANVRIILALDDYHLIEEQRIHQDLAFLLHHMPPAMHVIIASRSDPPLPLPRLRARGQLTEIRARDLRFSASEAATFLNQMMGLNLSEDQVALLDRRTEGWIAGLQLAAHSMQLQDDKRAFLTAFAGDDRYVADYLMEEVFNHQPAHVQEFLLQTSILDHLNPSLCDAVLERTDSRAVIDSLERSNLFIIPLDNKREWYRYHRLFADLLRERATESECDTKALHQRASGWYEEHGDIAQSVEHSLKARRFEHAMHLIEEGADELFSHNQITTVTQWWPKLPEDLTLQRPNLCMIFAWAWLATGKPKMSERCLDAIEYNIDTPLATILTSASEADELVPDGYTTLIEVAVVRSALAVQNMDIAEALRLAHNVLPYLDQSDQPLVYSQVQHLPPVLLFNAGFSYKMVGQLAEASDALASAIELAKTQQNVHIVALASEHLADVEMLQGLLSQAEQTCQQALNWIDMRHGAASPLSSQLLIILSNLLYERNDLQLAQQHLNAGLELTKMWRAADGLVPGYLLLARLRRAQGDWQRAFGALSELTKQTLGSAQAPMVAGAADEFRAILEAERGNPMAAQRLTMGPGTHPHVDLPYLNEATGITYARLLLASGAPDEALGQITELRTSAEASERWGKVIELLVLQTAALNAVGKPGDAMTALTQALRLAEPEGFIRTFVDAGPTIARLLLEAIEMGFAADYCRRLVAAFPDTPTRALTCEPTPGGDVHLQLEPLTPRELQVLQLIAEGFSNTLIAERLFLAPGTVKVHAHNIYSKLGVGNRTQAVTRARSLGILPHA